MRSLRAQVIALVTGAVVLSLALLAAFSSRSAQVRFRAMVESSRTARVEHPLLDSLRGDVASGGREALAAWGARLASRGEDAPTAVVVVAPGGEVVLATDSGWRGATARRQGATGVRLEAGSAGDLRAMVMDGGTWLVGPGADSVGLAFELPRVRVGAEVGEAVDDATATFGAALNRRILIGGAVILLLSVVGVTWLTRRLLDPVGRLTVAAERVAAGDYAARVGAAGLSELDRLAHTFDAMAASLERSEGVRRQLMRDVAHELRTPLTNLRAQIESIQDGLRTADPEVLASLHEEVGLLERLVGDVDTLARADAGQLELAREEVDLATVTRRAVQGFMAAERISGDRLTLEVASVHVTGDARRLGQVVRNLVENAIQHAGTAAAIHVTVQATATGAVLEVRDTGRGMAPEHVPRVFDRLYRPDASRARQTGGAGLGLSIVKAIVNAHGGRVELRSTLGEGTVVRVELPHATAGAEPGAA